MGGGDLPVGADLDVCDVVREGRAVARPGLWQGLDRAPGRDGGGPQPGDVGHHRLFAVDAGVEVDEGDGDHAAAVGEWAGGDFAAVDHAAAQVVGVERVGPAAAEVDQVGEGLAAVGAEQDGDLRSLCRPRAAGEVDEEQVAELVERRAGVAAR